MFSKLFKNSRSVIKIFIPVIIVLLYFCSFILVEYTPILRESFLGYFIFTPLFLLYLNLLFCFCLFIYLLIKLFRRKPEIPWFAISSFIVTVITVLFFFFIKNIQDIKPYTLPTDSDQASFNQKLWLENKLGSSFNSPRLTMLEDVVKRLPGKNKQEIAEMLGEATGEKLNYKEDHMGYYIGMGGSPGGDVWLYIFFDDKGLFKKYYLEIIVP